MTRHRLLLVVCAVVIVAAIGWLTWPDGGDEAGRPITSSSSTSSSPVRSSTTTSVAPTTTTTAVAPSTTKPLPPSTTAPTTVPPPPPTAIPPVAGGDRSVYVLGDSVLIGGRETVPAALTGWIVTFDAVGSRRLPQGIEVLRAHRQEIGAIVVIQMGNNYIEGEGGAFASQIDQAMTVLTGVPRVVWLTVAERWPSRVMINQAIRAAPGRWPNAVVADWAELVAAHPEYAGDQLHLTASGRTAIAQLIASHVGPPPAA